MEIKENKYAIIDVETTGMGIQGNRITEIAILVHDGQKVIQEYESLVNPERSIPHTITRLTGINDYMVADAPKFYEIAKEIIEITSDCIFVAHNVNFDYNVIHKEFADLGFPFRRKKLCTVRLSRKLIPGLPSYSLGKLCNSVGIQLNDRHRAMGDTRATTILFEKLLNIDADQSVFSSFLKPGSRQATLPPGLAKSIFDQIPERTGVYYFRDNKDDIIYVGKALNIKKRVLSHFYDKKNREVAMCQQTVNITFEVTGSELLALLLESSEIKHHYPVYNRAQRRNNEGYGIFSYEDRAGLIHLAWNSLKSVPNPITKFYNTTESRLFMEQVCEKFELCPKYCHLQSNVNSCFHYQIKKCKGICSGEEDIASYNDRVSQAIAYMSNDSKSYVIPQKGRHNEEKAFVLIENGIYQGFGYIDQEQQISSLLELKEFLILKKDNRDVQRILRGFRNKNESKFVALEEQVNFQM
ncbi:exonuclease domain-containing protein [Lutimonas halocynthiae]|uniref:exonuclease domain-containing protein n=1 Tax=Lutimonas halocynthiae TaxID=1446477 RepID=UPI0025B2DD48|nr:exonuclease domain-containing protein [Lutimonas halocynthiae]MDN3643992.1 exonuclease domain-containing protein [Lutimonas halocynthiae]